MPIKALPTIGAKVKLLDGAIERNDADALKYGVDYVIHEVDDDGSIRLSNGSGLVAVDDVEFIDPEEAPSKTISRALVLANSLMPLLESGSIEETILAELIGELK